LIVSEVYIVIVEGVITFIIVAALFYVSPGVLSAVAVAAPAVCSTQTALVASQTSINNIVAGGLNLSAISVIMLGIGLMIGGFMLVRGYRGG
jgi:hypothetical protein